MNTSFDDRRFSQERQLDSNYNWDNNREYPVIHDEADLLKVYERLGWLHKMRNSKVFGEFAKIYWGN